MIHYDVNDVITNVVINVMSNKKYEIWGSLSYNLV